MTGSSSLGQLEKRLAYHFEDSALLRLALTHRSAGAEHNQRLEFLGDAGLGMIMADLLYQQWPDSPEGSLSQLRASLVNQQTLAAVARELNLGDYLTLGLGERKSGGRQRDSILADAMEAVIGAVFLDGGFDRCRQCVAHLFASRLEQTVPADSKDAKTRLQELMQARGLPLPDYTVKNIDGAEHQQQFQVTCQLALLSHAVSGSGRSRKLAEQQAASKALQQLAGEGKAR
ncbi:ribonuclease III [Pseudohongiella spirulinae]|uniref:Ribonuclease 3 n=1 Tax=Pseudohongiella spirulinae TaxID=1249552 RepID=A0A0S2KD60_9GAMM|nr:ribonuclease III [Pseudohongiella spirulinae]ALO46248.1 Ribonuclease 3 [Pseudohongiella spirulinae]